MKKTKITKSPVRESIRHDYLTPIDFIYILLQFLSIQQFYLDVCCTQPNIPAMFRYTEQENGLLLPWKSGEIHWMNPPCGDMLLKFCFKMLQEVEKGAEVWALLPERFPGYYVKNFRDGTDGILRQASFVYIIPEWTFRFGLHGKKDIGLAKTSWWLCHFGKNKEEMYYKMAYEKPFAGTKYDGVLMKAA